MGQRIVDAMQRLLQGSQGISACALVEAESGLVWHRCGEQPPDDQLMWEAAIDYWRLHQRSQAHFASLGPLEAVALHHRQAVLAIFPCRQDTELLMVCRAAHRGVDWRGWQAGLRAFTGQLKQWL